MPFVVLPLQHLFAFLWRDITTFTCLMAGFATGMAGGGCYRIGCVHLMCSTLILLPTTFFLVTSWFFGLDKVSLVDTFTLGS